MECNKSIEFNKYVNISDIFNYKHVPGVWALLGQFQNRWEWITVASTEDIGEEIAEDVLFMMKDVSKRGTEHIYRNYWGTELFKFKIFNEERTIISKTDYYLARRKAMWAYIASFYNEFSFVCLVENEVNKEIRLSKEKYVATQTKAKYWNDLVKNNDVVQYENLDEIINSINQKYKINN